MNNTTTNPTIEDLDAALVEACHRTYGPDVDPWPVVLKRPVFMHKSRTGLTIDHPDFPRVEIPAGTQVWVYDSWRFVGATTYLITDGKGLFGEGHLFSDFDDHG